VDEAQARSIGLQLLTGPAGALEGWEVLGEGMENSRRKVLILNHTKPGMPTGICFSTML
jgi:hypothetical protein